MCTAARHPELVEGSLVAPTPVPGSHTVKVAHFTPAVRYDQVEEREAGLRTTRDTSPSVGMRESWGDDAIY